MKRNLQDILAVDEIKEEINRQHFDMTAHLFFHKRVSNAVITNAVDKFDMLINRKLIGRHYNDDRNKEKRIKFIGLIEKSKNGNQHIHLLVKFGLREKISAFRKIVCNVFSKVWEGGEIGNIQVKTDDITDDYRRVRAHNRNNNIKHNTFTDEDIKAQVDYYTKDITTDSIVFSRSW